MTSRFMIAAFIAAFPAYALAQDSQHQGMSMQKGDRNASSDAFEAASQTMMTTMMKPLTGDPDRDFATQMLAHHQGAIDMARIELRYGQDPELRALADDIIEAQEKEIEQLKRWQQKNAK